jgi:hypothetical protein
VDGTIADGGHLGDSRPILDCLDPDDDDHVADADDRCPGTLIPDRSFRDKASSR